MFSILSEREIIISATFILSSANAFNLDQSKILPYGKELIYDVQIVFMQYFYVYETCLRLLSW